MDGRWIELGDGVFVRRHGELDLTTGLVLGAERALVIDTRGDGRQGAELSAAVRAVTELPLVVAITHAHFDHCFGTAAFTGAPDGPAARSGGATRWTAAQHDRRDGTPTPTADDRPAPRGEAAAGRTVRSHDRPEGVAPATAGTPVYAQTGCAAAIRATADEQRAQWVAHYRETGDHPTADALAATDPVLPDHPVCPRPGDRHALDLGGRTVVLTHPGPGHTDHDLAVHVPDAAVLFAGDLLENGAPPSHGPDAHPDRWADAVADLLGLRSDVYVPGHGDPMTRAAAAAQHAELTEVAELWRAVAAGELTPDQAGERSPHPGVPWPA